jgi:glutathione synthase/RimK-type ligase-like ATP-grasp enzyme
MIILIGNLLDPVLVYFAKHLNEHGHSFEFLNQSYIGEKWGYNICNYGGSLEGSFYLEGSEIDFKKVRGIYSRLSAVDTSSQEGIKQSKLNMGLVEVRNNIECRVVNRPKNLKPNNSKPYQLSLTASINTFSGIFPKTYITNVASRLRGGFQHKADKIIFKSISGVRSIVDALSSRPEEVFDYVEACPTQLQNKIVADNLRVHVVGEEVFAARIKSNGVDYRYSEREIQQEMISDELKSQSINLVKKMGLVFAGVDYLVDDSRESHLLEVNPSPGYSFYERACGLKISESLAGCLYEQ